MTAKPQNRKPNTIYFENPKGTNYPDLEFPILEPPPNEIYRNRVPRDNTAAGIFGTPEEAGMVTYIPERLEFKANEGTFVWFHGCEYPSKNVSIIEAIYALTPIKKNLINFFRLLTLRETRWLLFMFPLIGKKRRSAIFNYLIKAFNEHADMVFTPFYFKKEYYSRLSTQIMKLIETLLINLGVQENLAEKFGEIIGCIFEFDNAYRYPLHDALNETNKDELLKNPAKEIDRVSQLVFQREQRGIQGAKDEANLINKYNALIKLLRYGLKLPKVKRAFIAGVEVMDWSKVKLDDADIFHTLLYDGYDMRGMNVNERVSIYMSMFPDITKAPPRIRIKNK